MDLVRSGLLGLTLAACAGCVTPRVQKMSFAEAFPVSEAATSVRAAKPARAVRPEVRPQATESPDLETALARFSAVAREQRQLAQKGSRMPVAQQDNWSRLLDAVDGLLDRAPAQTAPRDVIRARATCDAELELDGRAYGEFPGPLAERVMDRINRLATRMAVVRRLGVTSRRAQVTFEWPIDPLVVTSPFGRRFHPILHTWRQHYGVDLEAYRGQLVSAAARGIVSHAGWSGGNGKMVELRHPDGVITRYCHLSQILVEVGSKVDRGDPLGLAGSTGLSTGPHLHFEFWRDGRPRDPLEEMSKEAPLLARVPRS